MDARRLYIGQLLRNYKSAELFSPNHYTVKYQFSNAEQPSYRVFGHNEGIDFAIEYIRELERKVDELQYVEKIIKLAEAEERKNSLKPKYYT